PLLSRVIAVADAYNAMTSNRPYRDAMPSRVAGLRLAQAVETQFDTAIVAAFEAVLAGASENYRLARELHFVSYAQATGKEAREDEFYTQLPDIERELRHYKKHFAGTVAYLNCDDPRVSNFFHYFSYNFEKLGLKKLIATCYKSQNADLFSQNDSEHAINL